MLNLLFLQRYKLWKLTQKKIANKVSYKNKSTKSACHMYLDNNIAC